LEAKMRKFILVAVLALAGCTSQQLKSDEAVASSDLETVGTLVAGAAAAAEADPALMSKASTLANAALQKAGVPPTTASKISGAVTTKNATALKNAGLELASFGASLAAVSSQ
jgi:hypothetical protein